MNNILFIVSCVATIIVLLILFFRQLKTPVVIKHKLNPLVWFVIHLGVFICTVFLMLLADMAYSYCSREIYMTLGIKGLCYLFVQNGGLIIFVMLASSIIYNGIVKWFKFNYFADRYPVVSKLYFSVICFSLAFIYGAELLDKNLDVNILAEEYKLIMIWIIVLFQIWIGFGMKTDVKALYNEKILKQLKRIENKKIRNEERKHIFICFSSIILVPAIMMLLFVIDAKGLEMIEYISFMVSYGAGAGIIVVLLIISLYVFIKYPNEKRSRIRCEKIVELIQSGSKQGYYKREKYEISKSQEEYGLKIFMLEVIFDGENNFSKEYIKRARNIFDERNFTYKFKEYNGDKEIIKEKMIEDLSIISKARKDMLQEGFDMAYGLCIERERCKMT